MPVSWVLPQQQLALLGRWSDVTGRKFCLVPCLLMSAVGYLTMGFSYTLTILMFSRSITGMFKQSQSISRSMLSDITSADQRCRVYGRFNSLSSVGFILGPLVSSTIIQYEGGFYIVSCLCGSIFILNAVLMWFILPTTAPTKKKPSQYNGVTNIIASFKHLNWTKLWDIFLVNFFSGFSVMLFRSNSDMIFMDRFGTTKQHMSYLTSYTAVVSALCGFVSGWIAAKYQNNYRLYQHMVCGLFVALVALTLVVDFWMYILVLALLSFVTTNLRVASASLLVQRGGAEGVGAVMGLGDTVMSVARMLSPLLSGMALEISSSGPPLMGSVMAGIAVTLIILRSQTKLHQE
ncbi:major facilitator superfamily domain-containing protein 9-like isoform X2 [Mizuhopecten yessoensis]|uniref:major facilitator superfamily domain-containing protein 9-like isoform X2 n=1 Tax=Mizuhopecten yessoensis TaxID=6573 RepID=UPI000B45F3D4|nr:major facilitator superfamily domain-containing protein 9-like isoform X2 [Mizuhopecten yessoensis]